MKDVYYKYSRGDREECKAKERERGERRERKVVEGRWDRREGEKTRQ